MIVNAVVNFFISLAVTIMSPLPTTNGGGLAAAFATIQSSSLFKFFGWANNYLPISEAVSAVLGLLVLLGITYLVRMSLWLLRLLHVTGGR